jgi:hypothetical protein
MKKVWQIFLTVLDFLLFFVFLGAASMLLLIDHSMRTRGNFHGTVFPVQNNLVEIAVLVSLSLPFLCLGIWRIRRWLIANPPQWNVSR